jgi:hypothetical protein
VKALRCGLDFFFPVQHKYFRCVDYEINETK